MSAPGRAHPSTLSCQRKRFSRGRCGSGGSTVMTSRVGRTFAPGQASNDSVSTALPKAAPEGAQTGPWRVNAQVFPCSSNVAGTGPPPGGSGANSTSARG